MFSGKTTLTVLTRRQRRSFARSRRTLVVAAVSLVSVAAAWGQAESGSPGAKPTNHPPTVKIVSPKTGTFEENAQVRYEIEVSDPEDGESKFQEINSAEVLLIVRHFSNPVAAEDAMNRAIADDPPGLGTLRTSDCLNCHAFDARLIGPSFADIRKRYPYSQANVDSLSRHILQGTSGGWGSIKMPSHPELTMETAAACVTWLLKTAADPETNYYTGTEGSFRVTIPPDSEAKDKAKDKGILVLIASYTDHGLKDDPNQRMQGRDAIRIRIR
jgi:cytochrome c